MVPQTTIQSEPVMYTRSYREEIAPPTMQLAPSHRTVCSAVDDGRGGLLGQEAYNQSPLTSVYLARPPPLSRALAHPAADKELVSSAHLAPAFDISAMQNNGAFAVDPSYLVTSSGSGYKRGGEALKKGAGGKAKKDRALRHSSPYNRFMSQEVKRIKGAFPEVDHRKAFKMAASNWARSPTACQRLADESRAASSQTLEKAQSPVSITGSSDVAPSQNVEPTGWISTVIDSQQNGSCEPQAKQDTTVMREHRRNGDNKVV